MGSSDSSAPDTWDSPRPVRPARLPGSSFESSDPRSPPRSELRTRPPAPERRAHVASGLGHEPLGLPRVQVARLAEPLGQLSSVLSDQRFDQLHRFLPPGQRG
jgi:hypothetical protein